jgi:hypothetical protein
VPEKACRINGLYQLFKQAEIMDQTTPDYPTEEQFRAALTRLREALNDAPAKVRQMTPEQRATFSSEARRFIRTTNAVLSTAHTA